MARHVPRSLTLHRVRPLETVLGFLLVGVCVTGARFVESFGGRGMSSFSRIPKGVYTAESVSFAETTPHFEVNEDHSFWKEHNVQVLIRRRPLRSMERATQGNGKCLKQESPQSLVWLGHPETRFTFDHVASETISQDTVSFKLADTDYTKRLENAQKLLSHANNELAKYRKTSNNHPSTRTQGQSYL